MAITLVASGDNTGDTSDSLNTTGADLLVVGGRGYASTGSTSIEISGGTDSKGNSYTGLTNRNSGSGTGTARLLYCASPTVGSGHTVTITPSSAFNAGTSFLAFAGCHASPYDQESGATSSSATSLAPGSLTPSVDGCAVVTNFHSYTAGSLSIPSGYTGETRTFSGGALSGGYGYKIQTTAAAENPSWSWSGSNACSATLAVFKPAGGGGGGTTFHGHRRLPRMRSLLRM